jgi:hypothetical protein
MGSLIEETEELIKENEAYFGVVKIDHTDTIEYFLNISSSDLQNMSKEKILTMKFALEQYLASLSMKTSNLQTKLEINRVLFNRQIANRRSKYNEEFLSKELLIGAICNDRVEMSKMHNEILKMEGVLHNILNPVQYIKSMIETLKSLAYQRG